MRHLLLPLSLLAASFLVPGCRGGGGSFDGNGDDDDDGANVLQGTANVIAGPSVPETPFAPLTTGVPADGYWIISPNKVRARLEILDFFTETDKVRAELGAECAIEADRSAPSQSQILACPFEIAAGTYVGLGVAVNPNYEVLIDDAVNGIYSDPASATLLSTTPPVGGAAFVPYICEKGCGGLPPAMLAQPLVLGTGDSISVSIVVDLVHTISTTVSAGLVSFDSVVASHLVPILVYPTPGAPGKAQNLNTIGTAQNYQFQFGPQDAMRVYYSADQPMFLSGGKGACVYSNGDGSTWAADPATSPLSNGGPAGFRAGGYLGLDASGTLCWAIGLQGADPIYSSYESYHTLTPVAVVGSSATLSCSAVSTVPAPISGPTYASGCPAIPADTQMTVTLVAD